MMSLLLAILVAWGLVHADAGSDQEPWPPAGVFTIKEVTTPPEIVTQVNPTYTREGMRRRIQGFVVLQFVVEADGSVGPVRVQRSLDAASGLDDAAMATLKQWRFKPGTKDGQPVRVLASANLTFTLRDEPPPLTLPQGFSAVSETTAPWPMFEATSNNVQVQFQYPEGWRVEDSMSNMFVFAGRPETGQSVGIYRPIPVARPLPFPMPVPELMSFSEVMTRSFASQGRQAEVVGSGQSPLGRTNWVWLELDLGAGGYGWAFTTGVGTQVVQTLCLGGPPTPRMTQQERDTALANARKDCADILKRVVFTAR